MSVLFPQIYQYKPYLGTDRIKGILYPKYDNLTTFSGNVQPMSQFEIESLNIGRKNIGKIKIYTDTVFTISTEGVSNTGDIIVYDGNNYEVISKDNHTGTLLPHKKYIAEIRLLEEQF